jgi:predicted ATPase with chaperone activity
VGCRVWGLVEDRLIEVRSEPGAAFQILGLPEDRSRTTSDRVRAALLNSGLVVEVPSVVIHVQPELRHGPTSDLDLPVALGCLELTDLLGLPWILARGRLGLDGRVVVPDLVERITLADVLERLCHTPLLGFEHMFERGGPR